MSDCYCLHLAAHPVRIGSVVLEKLRCPACIDAILEAKNEMVRENARQATLIARLQHSLSWTVERIDEHLDHDGKRWCGEHPNPDYGACDPCLDRQALEESRAVLSADVLNLEEVEGIR